MNSQELFHLYVANCVLKPSSITQLEYTVRDFGARTDVSRESLVAYIRRRSSVLSPHTLDRRVVNIITMWKWAASEGLVEPLPGRLPRVNPPKVVVRATPQRDILRVLAVTSRLNGRIRRTTIPKSLYWSAAIAAFFDSALRTSDLLQLRMDGRDQWILTQVKTGKPVRVRPWPETLSRLRRLANVSPSLFDIGLHRGVICRGIKRYAARCGVYLTPQQLRRSAITAAEVKRPGAGAILAGHTDDSTTKTWYFDHAVIYMDVRGPRLTSSAKRRKQQKKNAG